MEHTIKENLWRWTGRNDNDTILPIFADEDCSALVTNILLEFQNPLER